MRKPLVVLLGLLFSAPFWGQEVVVFRDYRSLVVQSHRVQGDWTYLRVGGGELALLSKGILEIRQEAADSRAVTPSVPAGTAIGPVAPHPSAPQASPPQAPAPFRPPQPGMGKQKPSMDDDDGDDDAPEADDESDEEEPVKPMQPPPPIRPSPTSPGVVAKPSALMSPQNIVQSK
jgi:hypothetical protein